MRWLTFGFWAYLLLVLQTGLAGLWRIGGDGPDLLLILLTFVGLWCERRRDAVIAALILGALIDLTRQAVGDAGSIADAAIIGPHALGSLLGVWICLRLRTILFRDGWVVLAPVVLVSGLAVHLVALTLLTLRGLPLPLWLPWGHSPIPGWSVAMEMLYRFLSLLLTSVLALPLGWLLIKSKNFWGFVPAKVHFHAS